ncbi:RES family NAD+ phosphorylase [Spirosoma spitsbergense]|uniref:RES family NAD+ phosphorylase n=1 Tax=Spirosoma spitsbergense TaxID=431554 RepID=UPI000370AA6A|nr:RES family NAD+ phosphorylase [Spirosoma spitsbergense]
MDVYRILKEPHWNDPLTVVGAEKAPGRWNPREQGILYTGSSPALTLLEIMVHLPEVAYEALPALRLFTLRLPENALRWINPQALPPGWDQPQALAVTQTFFSEWLEKPTELGLAVPSAVLPISYNYLLHPNHTQFGDIQIIGQVNLRLERRLWKR